jgi:hypothetical protein
VPWNIALSRGDNHYIALTDFAAFPSGVAFTMQAVFRPGSLAPAPQNNDLPAPGFTSDMGSMLSLFGALQVVLADGDKAVRNPKAVVGEQPDSPVLMGRGGSKTGDEWHQSMWLWPVPPPGPVTFTLSSARHGVTDATVTMDATELIAASKRAEKLWDIGPWSSFMSRGYMSAIELPATEGSP